MTRSLRRLAARLVGRSAGPAVPARRAAPTAPPVIENDTRKPLAAVTFVWNEEAYLRKWVAYYGAQLGRENLFVFAHGDEPMVAEAAAGCHIHPLPRSRVDAFFARRKSDLAAGFVSFLLAEYRSVIVGDVDEMVVIDPLHGAGLLDFVEAHRAQGQSLKTFNLDLLDSPEAGALDLTGEVLAQRPLARTRYQFCKPVIVSDRVEFAAGFHYSSHYPVIAEGAYLVHLHFADRAQNAEIDRLRKESFEQNPHLAEAHQRSRGYWSKHMDRYADRNRKSAQMPVEDLDTAVPRLLAAMRAHVVKEPRTKMNAPGWTMTFGTEDDAIRLRLPDRFGALL